MSEEYQMRNAYEMFCRRPGPPSDPFRPRDAVFVDRDGTLIEDVGYIRDANDLRVLAGVPEALSIFDSAGFSIVVVSNQAGLARGRVTEQQFQAVHQRFVAEMERLGVRLDGCYYCPYLADGSVTAYRKDSDSRKPAPGMLLLAASRLAVRLPLSWMIGDKWDDVRAGISAGTRTVKLAGSQDRGTPSGLKPDFFAENLLAAARIINSDRSRLA